MVLYCKYIVFSLVFFVSIASSQNVEDNRQLAVDLYKATVFNKITLNNGTYQIDSSSNVPIRLTGINSELNDVGVRIFPDEIINTYNPQIIRFIERELWLAKCGKSFNLQSNTLKLFINSELADQSTVNNILKNISTGCILDFSISEQTTDKSKIYRVKLYYQKEKLDFYFPARVDLILGLSWENLTTDLLSKLHTIKFTKVSSAKLNPIRVKSKTKITGIYEDILDTGFIAGDSKLFYTYNGSIYKLLDSSAFPRESFLNSLILSDSTVFANTQLYTKIKRYGGKFDTIQSNLIALNKFLAENKKVYVAFEENQGKYIVDIYYYDKELNYFHLLYFSISNLSSDNQANKIYEANLYPFIRLDNVQDMQKYFGGEGKAKWEVMHGK